MSPMWNLSRHSRVYMVVVAVKDEPTSQGTPDDVPDSDVRPDSKASPIGATARRVDYSLLYGRQRLAMVRLARLLTGSFEVAEEIVQEAFLKLQLAPSVAQSPDAYLRTIVTNLSRGHLRRLRLERALLPEGRIVHPAAEIDETWAVVCALPFRQRAVLALRYYEDLPEAEIAQVLGCRLGTVKSSHHRALAAMRRQLS
jgi:RNA polymerase sigma factor (sigma-70 family)